MLKCRRKCEIKVYWIILSIIRSDITSHGKTRSSCIIAQHVANGFSQQGQVTWFHLNMVLAFNWSLVQQEWLLVILTLKLLILRLVMICRWM